MKNYDKLPAFLTVKFRGNRYEMEPAIIGSFGNMRLVYTDGTRTTVMYERIKSEKELQDAVDLYVAILNSLDVYVPISIWENNKLMR